MSLDNTAASRPFRIAVREFGPFEIAMQKFWDDYCSHSGCRLAVEMVPMDLHVLHDALLTQDGLKKGDWDVAHLNTNWITEAVAEKAVENLVSYIASRPPDDFPEGWSESLLSRQQFGEDIFGLPFHDGPECLIYRKDLFESEAEQQRYQQQYGVALQPPQTWEEFHRISRFFYRPEDNLYGTVFAGYPDGHNAVFDFCLQIWTRGGVVADSDGTVNINTPQALAGVQFYRELMQDNIAIHPKAKEYESVQAGLAFARGEAAMMVNWFGFASLCEVDADSQVKGKVDITNIPKGEGGKAVSLNVYWLYVIGIGSQYKEVAYDFIRFVTTRQKDKQLTLEGGIGCRLSTWADEQVNAIVPYYYRLEELHRNAMSLPRKSNWAQIADIIDGVMTQAITTDMPVARILKDGQARIEQLELKTPNSP